MLHEMPLWERKARLKRYCCCYVHAAHFHLSTGKPGVPQGNCMPTLSCVQAEAWSSVATRGGGAAP